MRKNIILVICLMLICSFYNCVCAQELSDDPYFKVSTLYAGKQYSECINVAKEMLVEDASDMEAYYFLSMSAYRTGDYALAYDTLKAQLEKNPKNETALYNAACVTAILNKEEESVDYLKRLLAVDISNKSQIKTDTDFDNVRDNDGYKKLMGISVVVGGELVEFDVEPTIIDGRTLLPVRKVFEAMGATVDYDGATKTVTAQKDDIIIKIIVDNKIASVNDEMKELDVPAIILDDRTLVPVRFVGEAFNADVEWDGENEIVNVIMPVKHGEVNLQEVQELLVENSVVSVVDGIFPEPYGMEGTNANTMIIFKDETMLEKFSQLNLDGKLEFMRKQAYDNFALAVGCSSVFVKIVYDSKVYYECDYQYESDSVSGFKYYSNGNLENIVKQYKHSLNYKDYYLLPEEERNKSSLEDFMNKND